jgi:hypothetical protein
MPKQDVAVEIFYDGAWHNVAAADEVFTSTPITIMRGQGSESAGPRPSSITMELNNVTDKYRTSNPESPLYGKAGRNTPVRISVGSSIRGTGEASSWAPDETSDFRRTPRRGRAWVDMEAGGLLQRVNQWTQPLRSPFYIYNANMAGLAGYFPMEDARGSTRATSTVEGAYNSVLYGVSFDSQRRPPGSAPLADIDSQSGATGIFRFTGGDALDNVGWQFSVCQYISALGALTQPLNVRTRNGLTFGLTLVDSTNEATLIVTDASGIDLINKTVSYGSYQWEGRWLMIGFDCSVSGGTVTVEAFWRAAEETFWTVFSDTYSGITSSVDNCRTGGIPGMTVGHILATNGRADNVQLEGRFSAFLGHAGERTAYRFARLCAQFGIGCYVSAGFDQSSPMGPQPTVSLPELFKECVQTEDGLLFDHRTENRLFFLLRADRYNQTPTVTLTPADFPALPKEVVDDQGISNVVTASQRNGGDYTVRDDTGPVGAQPPPNGVGEYLRSVDVNVADEENDLPQYANWWLRRGTVDLPRYPQIVIELAALSTVRAAQIQEVDVGDVIEIEGVHEYTIRLQVIGSNEVIGTHTRTVTYTCVPDQQFDVGAYDNTAYRRDSKSTVLKTSVNSTATALTFRTSDVRETWRTGTNPAGLFDVLISGELVRVTTMGSPTLVSGAYDQAATVVRSVNGIAKSLSVNEPIHVATPAEYAL